MTSRLILQMIHIEILLSKDFIVERFLLDREEKYEATCLRNAVMIGIGAGLEKCSCCGFKSWSVLCQALKSVAAV